VEEEKGIYGVTKGGRSSENSYFLGREGVLSVGFGPVFSKGREEMPATTVLFFASPLATVGCGGVFFVCWHHLLESL